MQTQSNEPRVLDKCVSCGGDPGGLAWEGVVLLGLLTSQDITALLHGALDHRGVVRLFTTGTLHGTKVGGRWVIRASQFVADWSCLEQVGKPAARRQLRSRPSGLRLLPQMEVAGR